MLILMVDSGHGGTDPGAVGYGSQEKNDVLAFTLKVGAKLSAKYLIDVRYTRTTDVFIELKERSNISDRCGANFFISFHENSFNTQAKGFESFAYIGAAASTKKTQTTIHNKVMAVYATRGVLNRGMKEANYSVLRECKASALLFENLFIDNGSDNALQHDAAFMDAVANAYVDGIGEAFNLPLKPVIVVPQPVPVATKPVITPTAPAGTIYRVQVGAFGVKANADAYCEKITAAGFKAYVKLDGTLYRVQVGAFSVKDNAEKVAEQLKVQGFNAIIK